MSGSFLINSRKYSISVRVLAGQGDGPLITIDASGHIHIDHGDPGPLRDRLQVAFKNVLAAVDALNEVASHRSAIGA